MIKFFRLIRKELIETGKTGKYFKYAIGEIILVVIGILIALSINNWNEQRKDNIKENRIVKSLYDELIDNFDYVEERTLLISNLSEKSGKRLLMLCNEKYTSISQDSLIALVYNVFLGIPAYAPKTSTFKRTINNEEFNLIQQDSLKTLLNQYQTILDFTYVTNNSLFEFEEDFWSYAQDKFGGIYFGKKSDSPNHTRFFENIPNSNVSFNPDDIISDMAFENLLTKFLLYYGHTINRFNQLQTYNETIRDYIDKHYKF